MVSDLPFCCRVCVSALPPSVVNAFLSVAATPLDATIGLAKWTQAICLRTDLELKVCSKYFTTNYSDVIYKRMKFQGLLRLIFIRLLFSGLFTIYQRRSAAASFLFSRTVRRGCVNIYYVKCVAQLF